MYYWWGANSLNIHEVCEDRFGVASYIPSKPAYMVVRWQYVSYVVSPIKASVVVVLFLESKKRSALCICLCQKSRAEKHKQKKRKDMSNASRKQGIMYLQRLRKPRRGQRRMRTPSSWRRGGERRKGRKKGSKVCKLPKMRVVVMR